MTRKRLRRGVQVLICAVVLAGCTGDPAQSEPYLELDAQRQRLEADVSGIEDRLDEVTSELNAVLETGGLGSVSEMSTQLAELAAQRDEAESLLAELELAVADLENESSRLTGTIGELDAALLELETMLQQMKDGVFE